MKYGIIIPSKRRTHYLESVVPRWLEQDLPVNYIVEAGDAQAYRDELKRLGHAASVRVHALKRSDAGTGYARRSCVLLALQLGYDAFIMSDDDAHTRDGDDVRRILKPVAKGFGVAIGGWTSQYGLWLPYGNRFGDEPGKLVPMNLSTDRVYALNPVLAKRVGNFDSRLKVKENIALQLEAIAGLNLFWYTSTSVHIVNVGKRYAPGGIAAHAGGGQDEVQELEDRDHGTIHARWGSPYISSPEKRMAIQWRKFVPDFFSKEALEYLYSRTITPDSEAMKPPTLKGRAANG